MLASIRLCLRFKNVYMIWWHREAVISVCAMPSTFHFHLSPLHCVCCAKACVHQCCLTQLQKFEKWYRGCVLELVHELVVILFSLEAGLVPLSLVPASSVGFLTFNPYFPLVGMRLVPLKIAIPVAFLGCDWEQCAGNDETTTMKMKMGLESMLWTMWGEKFCALISKSDLYFFVVDIETFAHSAYTPV